MGWREVLCGVAFGVSSALWMSWKVEMSATQSSSLNDAFIVGRKEAPFVSSFASCAPSQSCERVVTGPARTRLLGGDRMEAAPTEWRSRWSAEAMLDKLTAQLPKIHRDNFSCTAEKKSLRDAVGKRQTVITSIVRSQHVGALSQLRRHVDFVVTVGEEATAAACGIVSSVETASENKWTLAAELTLLVSSFLIFDPTVFFVKSPLNLVSTARPGGPVVALRTGMDLRQTPPVKKWKKPLVTQPNFTDCVIVWRKGPSRGNFSKDEAEAMNARTLVSQEHPIILEDTVAVHIRGEDDSFDSIKRLAQELQLWRYEGSDRRKYAALEDYTLATLPPDFHSGDKIMLILFNLVALAFFTQRIVVIPTSFHFEKHYYGWEWLDLKHAAETLGVQFVDSQFLKRRRFSSETKMTLRPDGSVGVEFVGRPARWFAADASFTAAHVNPSNELRKRLLFAAANELSIARDADVLFLDVDATILNTLVFPERDCFTRHTWTRRCRQTQRVEPWLAEFHSLLRFCAWDAKHLRTLNLISASDDCAAKRRLRSGKS